MTRKGPNVFDGRFKCVSKYFEGNLRSISNNI
jgi:hypothetical protein